MTNYESLLTLVNQLSDQAASYGLRETKAESARMRKTMNDIKKLITPAKQDLLNADKG